MAAPMLKMTKKAPASGNPLFCNSCEIWMKKHPGGAEIEMTLLFADVRGSTHLAEDLGPSRFAELMQRFYRVANKVLIASDAWIDRPVGDEIIALYLPIFAPQHARRAIEGAEMLLSALGADDPGRPDLGVGGGVHTGITYIGTVGVEGTDTYDITVLGDSVNVTSRLASAARAGEMLISDDAYLSSGLEQRNLEHRTLDLRGRTESLGVHVLSRAEVSA
jgi:adenylate cyclase